MKNSETADGSAGGLSAAEAAEFGAADADEIAGIEADLAELRERGIVGIPEERTEIKRHGLIKSMCLNVCHDCNLRCAYCFASHGDYGDKSDDKLDVKGVGKNADNGGGYGRKSDDKRRENDCGYGGKSDKYMSLDAAKAAVDFLIRMSGGRRNLEIDFFGGEPLMNLGVVKETVKYAEERCAKYGKNINFTMTTNGLLLPAAVDFLNEKMENVVISIDGRPSVHDRLRKTAGGAGSFGAVIKNAKEFRAARGDKKYYIRGTYTRENLDFGEDILFLNDCGFDQISVEPVVLPQDDPLSLSEADADKIAAEYERFASEYLDRRRTDKWFNFFHFMIDLEKSPCAYKRLNGCGAGDEYVAVTPSGEIFPCHQFVGKPEFSLGSVFGGELNSDIREKFQKSNVYTKENCGRCFAKYFCGGGCAANSVACENDINKVNGLYCRIVRKRAELSLAVLAEERKEKLKTVAGNAGA
ncbi:MAG: thioether cross-link-forming SCIFF peptide maturase [Clostridiales bacterium]|nr:thioether cross-link-forming SCIFF peptide maturase [Clostridiales bacterium]